MLYSLQSTSTTISSSSLPAASVSSPCSDLWVREFSRTSVGPSISSSLHKLGRIVRWAGSSILLKYIYTHFPAISLICSPSRLRPTLSSLALLTSPTFVPTTSLHVSEPTVFEKAFVIGQGHAAILHKLVEVSDFLTWTETLFD